MNNERRYEYRIEDPGGPQDGEAVVFGQNSPTMNARERFQLADGRIVWVRFERTVQS